VDWQLVREVRNEILRFGGTEDQELDQGVGSEWDLVISLS
jgi:hypothetical protein